MAIGSREPPEGFDYTTAIDQIIAKAREIAAAQGLKDQDDVWALASTLLLGAHARANVENFDGLSNRELVDFAQHAGKQLAQVLAFENAAHLTRKARKPH